MRIRDPKPSETGARGHSDPMDVIQSILVHLAEGKGSSSPRDGCFKCCGAHFQRDCNRKHHAIAMARRVNRASRGPRVLAKERARKVRETDNPKGNPKVPVPKVRTRVKPRKLVYPVSKPPEISDKFRNLGICTTMSH